jgi:hypothetical protein
MVMLGRLTQFALIGTLLLPFLAYSQETSEADRMKTAPAASTASDTEDLPPGKRIFGIIPNYRSSPSLKNYAPISVKEKFKIAAQDSFDPGTAALAAAFAGESMLAHSDPSFGQGVAGYSRYFGTAYSDFVIGNFMTEGIYPTILHQDPRYFRKGHGSGLSRLGYAVGQIFWTHNDNGTTGFNYSEVAGNATAVAIGMSYYPDDRNVGDAVSQWGTQLTVDMAANVLKEFWPDMERKLHHKQHEESFKTSVP